MAWAPKPTKTDQHCAFCDTTDSKKETTLPKVMIVDDDRTTVSLLKTLLEMDGFDVALVSRGGMVLDKARLERPDIFLMDYHLNDMDGAAVIKILRAEPQFAKVPIVMSSGLNV